MAYLEITTEGRQAVVQGDLELVTDLPEDCSWLVLAFADGSVVRVVDFDGVLRVGRMVPGTAECERYPGGAGESDRVTLKGDIAWVVVSSLLHWCRGEGVPMAHCEGCGYTAPGEHFDDAGTSYKDLRCPFCLTNLIDTSELAAANPAYGYGDDNTLRLDRG